MKSPKTWAEALGISSEQINEWKVLAPDEVPFVFWAIDQGHIETEAYLDWAKDHFGLPILKDEFFESPMELPRVEGPWTPWLMPISEWDGVLFVACVEPPPEQSWPQPIRFVLSSPETLRRAVDMSADSSPEPDEASFATLTIEREIPKKQVRLQLDPDALTGFVSPAAPTSPQAHAKPSAPAAPPPSPAKKAVLQLDDALEITVVSKPPPMPAASVVPAPAVAAPQRPKLPPAPEELELAQSAEQAFAWAFEQLSGHYSHLMVLKEDAQQASPWLWTTSWPEPKTLLVPANSLAQPSLFRIAAKTRRPYHGFIVANELHKEFFTNWGFSDLPACATAVPILVQNEFWGILLALGDENAESTEALDHAQQVAELLSSFLDVNERAA